MLRKRFTYFLLIILSTILFLLFLSATTTTPSIGGGLIYNKLKPKVIRVNFNRIDDKNVDEEETLLNYDKYDNFDDFDNNLGNIPPFYLNKTNFKKLQLNKTCGKYPNLYDLKFRATVWQIQETKNGTLHLFNAYFDDRKLLNNQPKIRILSMLNRLNDSIQMYCLFWYKNGVNVEKSANFLRIFTKGWGGDRNEYYQPYLITCDLPDEQENPPLSVTVVEDLCDKITNNLLIRQQEVVDKKHDFMVCVKGLNYPKPDKVIRLVEWIELVLILDGGKFEIIGVYIELKLALILNFQEPTRINFYEFNVHPIIKKVLNYYETNDKIELTPITLIGDRSNLPKLQNLFLMEKTIERRLQEVIPYNDCFYKHQNQYRYILLLDTDEVIIPKIGNWSDLIELLENKYNRGSFDKQPTSYQARNIYFLDSHQHQHEWFGDIPKYMHMLQHVYRAKNHTRPGFYIKSFFNTERVLTLHNHFARNCIGNQNCHNINIDIEYGQLQHYRADCVRDIRNCSQYKNERIFDTTIWNFKRQLIKNVQNVLYSNGILTKKP